MVNFLDFAVLAEEWLEGLAMALERRKSISKE